MNEIINKFSYFLKNQIFINKNFKFITSLMVIVILFFAGYQLYLYNKNQHILKNSIQFNTAINNKSTDEFNVIINKLSKEKNFYNIFSIFKKIKIKLSDNEIISANNDYLNILDNKNLNELYKSAIAINASFSLLNKINKNNFIEINKFIDNLLHYIDSNIDSYMGYKLEILFLLSIMKQDYNSDLLIKDEVINLYNQIQDNDKISSSLKERVKNIHEFQKYK